MKDRLPKLVILLMVLLINACSPKPVITESGSTTTIYDDTIHINNCGSKAGSTQTVSRSFSTRISGTGTIQAGYNKIVEGSVSSTYEQYRNITKSQAITAAPETNMEFVLRWSDNVRTGNVTIKGESVDYTVNIPISVEQLSSRDLGCGIPYPSTTPGYSYEKIAYVNECDKTIDTAIHYQNLAGEWITEGWWTLEPGETMEVGNTTNTVFYYYGRTKDGNTVWEGSDIYETVSGGSTAYGFIQVKMDISEWGTWNVWWCRQ